MDNKINNPHLGSARKKLKRSSKPDKLPQKFVDAFHVFPEELWRLIIDVAEEPVLQNLFTAIPKFFNVFRKSVNILQFDQDQYKPTIFTSNNPADKPLAKEHLLNYNWCKALDVFVNGLSLQQFYDKAEEPTQFQYIFTPPQKQPESCSFKSVAQINNFESNRTVESADFVCIARLNRVQFFQSMARLLEKRGENLQRLRVKVTTNNFPDTIFKGAGQVFNLLIECLCKVPNLKELSLILDDKPYCKHLQKMFDTCEDYPNFASLLSLCVEEPVTNSVLKYFFRGCIRQGQVPQLTVRRHSGKFCCNIVYELDKISRTIDDFAEFEKYIKTNCYVKITVFPEFVFENGNQQSFVGHFLRWVAAEKCNVSEVFLHNDGSFNTFYKPTFSLEPVPSVKYLKIVGAYISDYTFLKAFSNLEHLHIYFAKSSHTIDLSKWHGKENLFTKVVRKYTYEEPDFQRQDDIWKMFPSLKSFVVECVYKDEICKHYFRCLRNNRLLFTQ